MKLTNERAKNLWINARDSIRHALEHFSALSLSRKDKDHHNKWIVLSVHHCAQTFSCMYLKEFDENNRLFFNKKGEHRFPYLWDVVDELLDAKFQAKLTEPEKRLLELFKALNTPRNKIMHGEVLEIPDVSISAMTLVGISRVAELRCGESAEDIIEASPSILKDVVEAIRSTKLDEYSKLMETFVRERYPSGIIQDCLWCGAYAVTENNYPIRCEACFEEYDGKTCLNCNEESLILRHSPEIQYCFHCNNRIDP